MTDERRKILEMVAEGTISQEDGERLLEALGPEPEAFPAPAEPREEDPGQFSAQTAGETAGEAADPGRDLGERIASAVEVVVDRAVEAADRLSGAASEDGEDRAAPAYPEPVGAASLLALAGENEDGDAVHSLEIEWLSGEVEILPWEGTELRVTETANRPLRDGEQMGLHVKNGVLQVAWVQKHFRFGVNNLRKRLLVEIPTGQRLRALRADVVSADLRVEEAAAGALSVTTVSGKLEASGITADALTLHTVSGRLEAQGYAGDTVELQTVSGKLLAAGSAGALHAESVSGKVELALENLPREVRAESVSGKTEITLPGEPRGFTVTYESLSGGFESAFPLTGELKKRHGTGVYGDGSCRISMETTSGKMELRRA